MSNERRPILCPFKKIVEREYSGKTGITTINERFAAPGSGAWRTTRSAAGRCAAGWRPGNEGRDL